MRMVRYSPRALAEPTREGLAGGLRALLSPAARDVAREGACIARRELAWDVVAGSWVAEAEGLL